VLVSALASNGVEQKKGSQFGKIVMAIIGKYGNEVTRPLFVFKHAKRQRVLPMMLGVGSCYGILN